MRCRSRPNQRPSAKRSVTAFFFFLVDAHGGEASREHGEVGAGAPVNLKGGDDVYELEREEGIPGKQKWRQMVNEVNRELARHCRGRSGRNGDALLDVRSPATIPLTRMERTSRRFLWWSWIRSGWLHSSAMCEGDLRWGLGEAEELRERESRGRGE